MTTDGATATVTTASTVITTATISVDKLAAAAGSITAIEDEPSAYPTPDSPPIGTEAQGGPPHKKKKGEVTATVTTDVVTAATTAVVTATATVTTATAQPSTSATVHDEPWIRKKPRPRLWCGAAKEATVEYRKLGVPSSDRLSNRLLGGSP